MEHQTATPATKTPEAELDVGFLAEVLVDQELPLTPVIDLTVIDLTGSTPNTARSTNGWGLYDETTVGRLITPVHVLAARREYQEIIDGRSLDRSVGTFYQTAASFAADYLTHVLRPATSPTQAGLAANGQHRLEHFLNLTDDDFFACFRFNGDITGEYLTQVARCERSRHEHAAESDTAESDTGESDIGASDTAESVTADSGEPSPKQRRIRKAQSLREV